MSKQASKKIITPLIDRLTANINDSEQQDEYHVIQRIRENVRQDLEDLLNTRICFHTPQDVSRTLDNSLLNFGLNDISTLNLTTFDSRVTFCREIEKTILKFDPRIKHITVKPEKTHDNEDPSIRFKVEAELYINPNSQTLIFNTSLNPINQSVNIKDIF